MNRNDSLWQELRKVYIFDVKPDNATSLYMELCKFRIEQDVFFDTCGVFRKSNPLSSCPPPCNQAPVSEAWILWV